MSTYCYGQVGRQPLYHVIRSPWKGPYRVSQEEAANLSLCGQWITRGRRNQPDPSMLCSECTSRMTAVGSIVPVDPSGAVDFDDLRRENEDGEYWSARDLMPCVGYSEWRNFRQCIERAKISARNVSNPPPLTCNFVDATINDRRTWYKEGQDCRLSRYAVYLTLMEGDASKPEIARAKTYFAVQTRKAEVAIDGLDPEFRQMFNQLLMMQELKREQKRQEIKIIAHDEQIATNSQAIADARDRAEVAVKQIEAKGREITDLAGRLGSVERITPLSDPDAVYSVKEVAQLSGDFGLIKFYAILREIEVVYEDKQKGGYKLYQDYFDKGWGHARMEKVALGNTGRFMFKYVPYFTAQGIVGIQGKMEKRGYSLSSAA